MNAGRCCYVASFVVVYRWVGGGGWGQPPIIFIKTLVLTLSSTLCDCTVRKPMVHSLLQTASKSLCGHEMRKVRSSFRPWFSSQLSHVLLRNRNNKIKETALQMVGMFYTTLVIHGRCKIFLFQHRQTLSSSAMKMEL